MKTILPSDSHKTMRVIWKGARGPKIPFNVCTCWYAHNKGFLRWKIWLLSYPHTFLQLVYLHRRWCNDIIALWCKRFVFHAEWFNISKSLWNAFRVIIHPRGESALSFASLVSFRNVILKPSEICTLVWSISNVFSGFFLVRFQRNGSGWDSLSWVYFRFGKQKFQERFCKSELESLAVFSTLGLWVLELAETR